MFVIILFKNLSRDLLLFYNSSFVCVAEGMRSNRRTDVSCQKFVTRKANLYNYKSVVVFVSTDCFLGTDNFSFCEGNYRVASWD